VRVVATGGQALKAELVGIGQEGARALTLIEAAGPATATTGPMIFQGSARYPVDAIVIHFAATAPDWMRGQPLAAKRKEIVRWHREQRDWRKIGYHHLIDRDGATLPGRAETEIGAGVECHNRGVIHICLIGGAGSAATDLFERNITAAQDRVLRGALLRTLAVKDSHHESMRLEFATTPFRDHSGTSAVRRATQPIIRADSY
jgi:hypothetical protein